VTALNGEATELGPEVSFGQQRLTIANYSARADEGGLPAAARCR
jgi:hypothetical protein